MINLIIKIQHAIPFQHILQLLAKDELRNRK